MPRPMILSPWPMILRSLPMTDFSPPDGGVRDRCPLLAPLGPVVRDSVLGSIEEPRVNMKAPDEIKATMVIPGEDQLDEWWKYVSDEH